MPKYPIYAIHYRVPRAPPQMKKSFHLGQSEFEALLNLLSDDRDEAGGVYERLRRGLSRFFRYKGCSDPEGLVDETFNRIAARTHKFDPGSYDSPERYFYGFAVRIAKEHKRDTARLTPLNGSEAAGTSCTGAEDQSDSGLRCLQSCLGKLDVRDEELINEYYSLQGRARIDLRHRMCERLSCTSSALYVRTLRIRKALKGCIEKCLKKKM